MTPIGTATATPTPTPVPIHVACVGDSITYGQGVDNPNINSYPALLGQKLGSGYQVRNYGVSGASVLTSDPLPYQRSNDFAQALAFKPDIVVVELGTNDSINAFGDAQKAGFVTDYETLITRFRQANSAAKVYVCLPLPSYPQTKIPNQVLLSTILPLVRRVGQETGSTVIDLNTPFTDRQDLFRDGYHPTTEGASVLATLVYNGLISTTALQGRHK